ncbi:MAG: nitrate- and nitrite sensing domain-containing protein, partial [Ferrovibrio sp.]
FKVALEPLRAVDTLRELVVLGDRARTEMEAVPGRRGQIDALALPGPQSFAGYTTTIRSLLRSVHGMAAFTHQAELTTSLNAYLSFLEGKEKAGQERATGAGAFAAKRFDPEIYQRFVGLGLTQEADFAAFLRDATPAHADYYVQLLKHPSFAEVQRLRKIGYDFIATGTTGDVAGPHWFQTTTQRIDQLKLMEDRLAADLNALCAKIRSSEQRNSEVVGGVVAVLLLLAILLSGLIISGLTRPLSAVVHAMSRLAAGDMNAAISYKARGDQIGDLVRAYEKFV